MLKCLSISSCPWTNIILKLITGLPSSNNYDTILMVVDSLTRKKYYITCITDENNITTETVAQLFFQKFGNFIDFYHHLLQIDIFCLFTRSRKIFARLYDISPKLSIFYHLEIDEHSKITNHGIEKYLPTFINY